MIFASSSEVYGDYDDVMQEEVLDRIEVRQLNDHAITKWVNELQIMNSAAMHQTETMRVRLFNTYGPGEYYTPYRSVVCRFIYHALSDLPYTVHQGHLRTFTYVTDTIRTLVRMSQDFRPGSVYNLCGMHHYDVEHISRMILDHLGKDDGLVTYAPSEPFTTRIKRADASKAVRDYGHAERVGLETGIPNTIEWMKTIYAKSEPGEAAFTGAAGAWPRLGEASGPGIS